MFEAVRYFAHEICPYVKNCLTQINAGVSNEAADFFYRFSEYAREQGQEESAIEYLFANLQITSKLLFYIQQTADKD